MLSWLAAADPPRGSAVVDWLPISAPLAAILAALIAAAVARLNVRKPPPHEQLETLMQLYRDWPVELEGKATIERQISLLLAELRVASDDAGQPGASSTERAAEQRVFAQARRLLLNRTLPWILVGGSLVTSIVVSFFYPPGQPHWVYELGLDAMLVGGALYFFSFGLRILTLLRSRHG
ncbi:hypothetical protein [Nocardia sp. 852002-51244_SCH5132740]|uniref:hypothetical protein n=1 Tax=Nocardia sp. 852002-51244_SCH5132740 TaxID=1834099 RepID=UPI0012EB0200|nr:hypothetical protein [Nocardia sp. 852002-51244_SCH5132740]